MKFLERALSALVRKLQPKPRAECYSYACPVCNYLFAGWTKPREHVDYSYDICPCCFTEFGLDDFRRSHEELRQEWIAAGMKWHSDCDVPPKGWNPREQLMSIGTRT